MEKQPTKTSKAVKNLTDIEYYSSLQQYQTCCYFGKGVPIFLPNTGWYKSLSCLIYMDVLLLAIIVIFIIRIPYIQSLKPKEKYILLFTNVFFFILVNSVYILTQILNPGIRNTTNISEEEYQKYGKVYCIKCQAYRTQSMEHCFDCRVCVEGLDHHCGFFNKCIAGYQKYLFYLLIVIVFLYFVLLLFTLVSMVQDLNTPIAYSK